MPQVITPVSVDERTKLGIRPGDTVRVHQKIVEKGKSRIQAFEGLVIAVKHGTEPGATFTVRATMSGIGVERIFPLYAPFIEKIEITRRSKVRRAKLYFIREKVARQVRRQLRNMRLVKLSTDDFKEEEKPEEPEMPAEDATEEVATAEIAAEETADAAPAEDATSAEEAPAADAPATDVSTEGSAEEKKDA